MNKKKMMDWMNKNKPLIVLAILVIAMAIFDQNFFSFGNIVNVFRQTSINAIIAAGLCFAILIGGIDLSVGSVLAFSSAIMASLLANGTPLVLALLVALLIGAAIGFLNGLLISKGNIQPFIATLATMTLFRALTLVFTDGRPISSNSEGLSWIGTSSILKIPVPIYIMAIIFILAWFILKQMKMGRYIYALGSNEEATLFSGINTDRIKWFVYTFSGVMAALAGIIATARLGSAQPTAGTGYELDAIAAVVLGGTSMSGGVGGIGGTLVGALIIGILNNALNLLQIPSYYQGVAKGLVILLAVLLDRKQKR